MAVLNAQKAPVLPIPALRERIFMVIKIKIVNTKPGQLGTLAKYIHGYTGIIIQSCNCIAMLC